MALVVKDRVQESTTTTGTGTLTLSGATTGFQTFSSAIGNGNTTYYSIVGGSEWEVGIGTVAAGTLARTTILSSSNSGIVVTLSSGTKNVFCTYPAFIAGNGAPALQSVQTTGFTAVAGNFYPCNTTSAAFTVTLPASPSIGDTIILVDYAGTFATNNITLGANSNKIEGGTANKKLTTNREAVTITYVDSTQGWVASSGVNSGTQALDPSVYSVDFLVIAGGGGGGPGQGLGGGAGAGGYRNSYASESSGGGGSTEANIDFNVGTVYTITVGAGGAGGPAGNPGSNGVSSSISGTGLTTLTSVGGGGGGRGDVNNDALMAGASGGSGGGGGENVANGGAGGAGTANQGFAGGVADFANADSGGGGGAGEAGNTDQDGDGGDGLSSSITGSSVARGGGGAGSSTAYAPTGGTGGGANGRNTSGAGNTGTANTGGGGGGAYAVFDGGAGGKGVVILRMPTASYSGTTTGSPTVTTSGADTILVFNDSGTITG